MKKADYDDLINMLGSAFRYLEYQKGKWVFNTSEDTSVNFLNSQGIRPTSTSNSGFHNTGGGVQVRNYDILQNSPEGNKLTKLLDDLKSHPEQYVDTEVAPSATINNNTTSSPTRRASNFTMHNNNSNSSITNNNNNNAGLSALQSKLQSADAASSSAATAKKNKNSDDSFEKRMGLALLQSMGGSSSSATKTTTLASGYAASITNNNNNVGSSGSQSKLQSSGPNKSLVDYLRELRISIDDFNKNDILSTSNKVLGSAALKVPEQVVDFLTTLMLDVTLLDEFSVDFDKQSYLNTLDGFISTLVPKCK